MTSAPEPGEAPRSCEVWLRVSDGVVAGVHHALNNRMAALAAVAQVLEAEAPAASPLRAALAQEVERLRATVGLLSLLPHGADPRPEPVQARAVLDDALELYRVHHALRDLPCDVSVADDVLPLWIDPVRAAHVLLVLLAAAGRAVGGAEGGRVRVEVSGDPTWVSIRVEAQGTGARSGPGDELLTGVDARAVLAWVREADGELEVAEGERYLVRLPTLLEVRRREGAGGSDSR